MNAWRESIPRESFLELQYQELVSDPESVIRKMIEFCRLDWDEACLHPEAGTHHVATPSMWQVRQPIYQSSTERWRRYEPWLGPFAKLMNNTS